MWNKIKALFKPLPIESYTPLAETIPDAWLATPRKCSMTSDKDVFAFLDTTRGIRPAVLSKTLTGSIVNPTKKQPIIATGDGSDLSQFMR